MTDRELLELAAKAINFDLVAYSKHLKDDWIDFWNPLTDDGDALRLAVKLNLLVDCCRHSARGLRDETDWSDDCGTETDPYAATRRAIVRAAAEIAKEMKMTQDNWQDCPTMKSVAEAVERGDLVIRIYPNGTREKYDGRTWSDDSKFECRPANPKTKTVVWREAVFRGSFGSGYLLWIGESEHNSSEFIRYTGNERTEEVPE